MSDAPTEHSAYWRSTLRLSAGLLGVWLLVTLAVCLFGPSLTFGFFGWPFGFWATAQGALLVFCAIVWVYAFAMDRLDEAHGRPAGD
jgi:putative solute:sodium symporter small subunit